MPILDVEIVVGPEEALPPRLAADIADAAGEVFAAAPGHTWVKLRPLDARRYGESGGGPPQGALPVFVSVLKRLVPPEAELAREVARLAAAIAHVCQRPAQNVHILYSPAAEGRMAFGGRLIRAERISE